MNADIALSKLNSSGRELYEMFVEVHKVSGYTAIQIERILSLQQRIVGIVDNPQQTISGDVYPKRFRLEGKRKHGGYLDTKKFWKIFSGNPDPKSITEKTQEHSIAQA